MTPHAYLRAGHVHIEPPCTKARFASRKEAQITVKGMRASVPGAQIGRGKLQIYLCPTCINWWHIGHKKHQKERK